MNDLAKLDDVLPAVWPAARGPAARARAPLPADAGDVRLRDATTTDLPFVDALQKKASRSLGFMTRGTLEGKVRLGDVTIAESRDGEPVGYCIASDRYYKREDCGVIYQVNVAPGRRRDLVGAALVRGAIARWPYGVKLACCWCAQDLEGPMRFWESLGFVPLAYRGGSRGKGRVHVFWQRRVRQDDEVTPYWYPSQTTGGMICEDRLVLPIPPGIHWSEAKPVILPGDDRPALPKARRRAKQKPKAPEPTGLASGGFRFGPPPTPEPEPEVKEKTPAAKNDPILVRKVRELRDRYLEAVEERPWLLAGEAGKYDVGRALPAAQGWRAEVTGSARLLPAA